MPVCKLYLIPGPRKTAFLQTLLKRPTHPEPFARLFGRHLEFFFSNTPIQKKTGSRMETRPKGPSVFASPGGKYKLDKQSLSKEFQDGASKY